MLRHNNRYREEVSMNERFEMWAEEHANMDRYYADLDRYFTEHTGDMYDFEEGHPDEEYAA